MLNENDDANIASTDIVYKLSKQTFSSLSFGEKIRITTDGRPTPKLDNLKSTIKKSGIIRTFNPENYGKYPWMCGSLHFQKLFCWPCILFSNKTSAWNSFDKGYSDLNNLHTAVQRHSSSESHLLAWLKFKSFGSTRMDTSLSKAEELAISKHNKKVKNNREVLKRLIATVCLLGKQEIGFRGHDESSSSCNRGNYIEMIHTIAEFDEKLYNHLENATVFTDLSSNIQNDLIQCIGNTISIEIKNRIKEATFVAISMDESSDVSNLSQLSVVFRYIHKNHCAETFIGFFDVSADRTANAISNLALDILKEFGCLEKLIAQTYDGAAVMSGHLNGVQAKLKNEVPEALFIHCYSHRLNLVLSQSVSYIKQCKIFFSTLNGLVAFFSTSTKRTDLLDTVVKKRLPTAAPTRWSYSALLVENVFEHYEDLISLFEHILDDDANNWDQITLRESVGYLATLKDFEFVFLLRLFFEVFPHTEIAFNVLQNKQTDIPACTNQIETLKSFLNNTRCNFFEPLWKYSCENRKVDSVRRKRRKIHVDDELKDSYRKLFFEVVDCLIVQINDRFQDLKELNFLQLAEQSKFEEFARCFPDNLLNDLKLVYPKHFDFVRLKSELNVLYKTKILKSNKISEHLEELGEEEYNIIMPEVYKLYSLIMTIPSTSASFERSLPALKRIKTYVRNRMGEDRLPWLGLMSIEKDILFSLKQKEDFYNHVIAKFCEKTRRMEFNFK